ncbi:MAG: hypothetical protein CMA64_09145 [Euryarchaeota archaeon]|nr:hypothetical protein [Euryarchaeota archaeon]
MDLNFESFGKFKIIQDDGNWVDRKRFGAIVDYWGRYFSTMTVLEGAIIHKAGDKPNVKFDHSPKKIVIKGHTCINTLAILFASVKCGHTLYFDNANNLTEEWYNKVKPDILMVGEDDLSFEGSRYTSGPNCVRLLFTRRFRGNDEPFTYSDETMSNGSKDSILIEHSDTKVHKYKKSEINELIKSLLVKKTEKGKEVAITPPAVAFLELDTSNQVSQLVKFILPLMVAGSKIILDTGVTNFNVKDSITEHRPDLVYWGKQIGKMIKDKDSFITNLSPAPLYVPHIRQDKKVEKAVPEFIKDPDTA